MCFLCNCFYLCVYILCLCEHLQHFLLPFCSFQLFYKSLLCSFLQSCFLSHPFLQLFFLCICFVPLCVFIRFFSLFAFAAFFVVSLFREISDLFAVVLSLFIVFSFFAVILHCSFPPCLCSPFALPCCCFAFFESFCFFKLRHFIQFFFYSYLGFPCSSFASLHCNCAFLCSLLRSILQQFHQM